ncbi:hypothetical protein PCE1_002839 [Barthelona sp. PCE]
MGLLSFFKRLFRIFKRLRNSNILFLGLDCAGKSTLLYYLLTGRLRELPPTAQVSSEHVELSGGLRCLIYDVGGHESIREVWSDFLPACDALVWMIDVADTDRYDVSRQELQSVLKHPALQNKPVLVLGNKFDMSPQLNVSDIVTALDLNSRIHERPIHVQLCSVTENGYGLEDGFNWLSDAVRRNK